MMVLHLQHALPFRPPSAIQDETDVTTTKQADPAPRSSEMANCPRNAQTAENVASFNVTKHTLGRFQCRESKWIFKSSSIYAPSSKFDSSWITRSADYVCDSLPTVSLITQCMSNLTFTACVLAKYLSPGRSEESWSWRASYNLLCHQ